MENTNVNYQPKKGVKVPKDVKEYVLRRIKESGKDLNEIAREHGMSRGTLHRWMREESGSDGSEVLKLQKENHLLKQLVAELSLRVHITQKKNW